MEDTFEKIYENLKSCYYYNKYAKSGGSRKFYYKDKYRLIADSINLISSTKTSKVKVKFSKDKTNDSLFILHFYLNDKRADIKSFSFPLPNIYEQIFKEKLK